MRKTAKWINIENISMSEPAMLADQEVFQLKFRDHFTRWIG